MISTEIGNLKPGHIVLMPVVIRDLDHHTPDDEPWNVCITARAANYSGTDFKVDEFDLRSVLKVDEHDQADRERFEYEIEARDCFLAEDAEQAADPAGYAQRKQERHDRYMAIVGRDTADN